jgi:hypothetical protein
MKGQGGGEKRKPPYLTEDGGFGESTALNCLLGSHHSG